MHAEIRTLLAVQELDKEVIELKDQLSRYPRIWDDVKKTLDGKREALDRAEKNKERHIKERRRVEQKLRILSEDHKRFQGQQVKTTKEFEAQNKQIEQAKAKITQQEEAGLALLERDSSVDKAIVDAAADLKSYEAFAAVEKERIRGQFNSKKDQVAELEKAKADLIKQVPADLLAVYERIVKRHPGSAIVPVHSVRKDDPGRLKPVAGKASVMSGSCGGCHFSLLTDMLVRVRREERMVLCPNCGRLLSEDENYVPDTEESVAK